MKVRVRVGAGLVVVVAALIPLIGLSPAAAVVPSPQFNCVAEQTTTFTSTVDVPIDDPVPPAIAGAPATSTISVTGLTGTVYDIDVVTRIPHTSVSDLAITLTSPSGRMIELSVGNGNFAGNAFNGTTWDDDADPDGASTAATNDGLVTDHNYVDGVVASPLVPQEALAVFLGDIPNGVWTLSVEDFVANDTGMIDDWSLVITTDRSSTTARATTSSQGTGIVIPNGGSATTTMSFPEASTRVRTLVLTTTSFGYTGLGDLTLTLQSPTGTLVTLTSRNGDAFVVVSGTKRWSLPIDASATPVPISRLDFTQPSLGSFAPEESFGAFVGEDPTGVWTLVATDAGAIDGGGAITGATIRVVGNRCSGAAELTSFTGPATGTRIGEAVAYEAVVKSSGDGAIHDIRLRLIQSGGFRSSRVDPGAGGTCSPDLALALTCTWAGPTAPGTERRLRVDGEAFIAAQQSATVSLVGFHDGGAPIVGPPRPLLPIGPLRTLLHGPTNFLPALRTAGNGRPCTVLGTESDDSLPSPLGQQYVHGPHVYCGLGGKDRIDGGSSNDVIDGGADNDILFSRAGKDWVDGGDGDDSIIGGQGNDDLRGGRGLDTLRGGDGADRIVGGRDADRLEGGNGPDILVGGQGADRLLGQAGRDRLEGGAGPDILNGGSGVDFGLKGAGDRLFGVELPR